MENGEGDTVTMETETAAADDGVEQLTAASDEQVQTPTKTAAPATHDVTQLVDNDKCK